MIITASMSTSCITISLCGHTSTELVSTWSPVMSAYSFHVYSIQHVSCIFNETHICPGFQLDLDYTYAFAGRSEQQASAHYHEEPYLRLTGTVNQWPYGVAISRYSGLRPGDISPHVVPFIPRDTRIPPDSFSKRHTSFSS